jgi:hypothetical protein
VRNQLIALLPRSKPGAAESAIANRRMMRVPDFRSSRREWQQRYVLNLE